MKKKCSLPAFVLLLLTCLALSAVPVQAAKKKTVDVMTKMKFKAYTGDGMLNVKFAYTKKGLVKSKSVYSPDNPKIPQMKTTYTYNADNMVTKSEIYQNGQKAVNVTYKYNSKNQLVTRKTVSVGTPKITITAKYTYQKGILATASHTYKGTKFDPTITTFTFNAKGQPSKIIIKGANGGNFKTTTTYKYDKNGYMKSQTYSGSDGKGTMTRKLTYKNGKLVKYQDMEKTENGTYTDNARTITWKQISVPAGVADLIDRQQKEIINTILPYSLLLGNDYM